MIIAYLIGQITADPITYEWRRLLREELERYPKEIREELRLIDPCANPFSQQMLDDAVNGNIKFAPNVVKNKQAKLFPAIDKSYVKEESNSCVFNANHYSPETPFLGTVFELAWYHDQPWKPVIGVFEGNPQDDYLCSHPFVTDTVHTWVQHPNEALELLISLLHA